MSDNIDPFIKATEYLFDDIDPIDSDQIIIKQFCPYSSTDRASIFQVAGWEFESLWGYGIKVPQLGSLEQFGVFASLSRKRSRVQIPYESPYKNLPRWSSGLGCLTFTQEDTSSNLVRGTLFITLRAYYLKNYIYKLHKIDNSCYTNKERHFRRNNV